VDEKQGSGAPRYSADGRWWWDGRRWVPAPKAAPIAGLTRTASRLPWIALGLGITSLVFVLVSWSTVFLTPHPLPWAAFEIIVVGFVLAPVVGAIGAALGLASRGHLSGISGCVCGAAGVVSATAFWIYLVSS